MIHYNISVLLTIRKMFSTFVGMRRFLIGCCFLGWRCPCRYIILQLFHLLVHFLSFCICCTVLDGNICNFLRLIFAAENWLLNSSAGCIRRCNLVNIRWEGSSIVAATVTILSFLNWHSDCFLQGAVSCIQKNLVPFVFYFSVSDLWEACGYSFD